MPESNGPDRDTQRGLGNALQAVFGKTGHVGADAAGDEFAALLAKLDDPPEPYRKGYDDARH